MRIKVQRGKSLFLLLIALVCLNASCKRIEAPTVDISASVSVGDDQLSSPRIEVEGDRVEHGDLIEFYGTTNIPEGNCFYSELSGDELALKWWPVGKCFPLSSSDWRIHVPLGRDGVPENLDPETSYSLRIWWPGAPDIAEDKFYFDLGSPPEQ